MDEIKELNIKMHDRLVEILVIASGGKIPKKVNGDVKMRLLYNASRLKKYDISILTEVNSLLTEVFDSNDQLVEKKDMNKIKKIVEKIEVKVDKLWFS